MKAIRNFSIGILVTICFVIILVTFPVWGLAWIGNDFYRYVIQDEEEEPSYL